jgi:hypothetical protein
MCTKWFADGDVHKYFNPYHSPYDAYIYFMNVMDNLDSRCSKALRRKQLDEYAAPSDLSGGLSGAALAETEALAKSERITQTQNKRLADKLYISERSLL